MKGPKLLHLQTIKGKGLEEAEKNPTIYHAPGLYDPDSGERIKEDSANLPPKFQDVFGATLVELASQNPRIVGVTPAMPTGCGMTPLFEAYPDRAFDVGIAEGHAVTFSAGMAKEGMQPFCNIYSAFAQRAYDNIIHDAALLRLPVVLCFDRAGIVGEDGPTHHGAFDLCALRPVPNLTIASPYDECELRRLMFTAQQPDRGTFVIRYPRGRGRLTDWHCPLEAIPVGKGRKLKEGTDIALLSFGPIGNVCADAIAAFEQANQGQVSVAHYDLHILTVEDGARAGGVGSAVAEWMLDNGFHPVIKRIGMPDHFVPHGTPAQLYAQCGMDKAGIIRELESFSKQ